MRRTPTALRAGATANDSTHPTVVLETAGTRWSPQRDISLRIDPRRAALGAAAGVVVLIGAIQLFGGRGGDSTGQTGGAGEAPPPIFSPGEAEPAATPGRGSALPRKDAAIERQLDRLERLLEDAADD